ncbi:nucleoside 2-deoxyribosyltransferase [Patescibacteria group bacterium]|jgi:nucleoside 2-deoxyribosyltransferase|nr:nucleoside 2-deoxyribosyltransferase [Patescibacteria group bacterium]
MKLFFAGSIRGGTDDLEIYAEIVKLLSRYGRVHSDHMGDSLNPAVGSETSNQEIYQRDLAALAQADVVIAEITQPSLGVGYQIGRAEGQGTPVLALYRNLPDRHVSAMMTGNPHITVDTYTNLADVERILDQFIGTWGQEDA